MKKQHLDLIYLIEDRIVGILIAHGYVKLIKEPGPLRFSNIEITDLVKSSTKQEAISDIYIKEYMQLWPAGYRSTPSAIRPKINRFLREHNCTFSDIMAAAKKWLQHKDTPYHGYADYFFYKAKNGGETSRCEEYLELVKAESNNTSDFRDEYT